MSWRNVLRGVGAVKMWCWRNVLRCEGGVGAVQLEKCSKM